MADKGAYNNKETPDNSKQSFLTFVCNRRTGEFCGRTAGSWAKILIFYVIFYACLAAFWAVMLLIFYQTISYEQPKWTLDESRIGTNPGLGYRPRAPPNKVDSTLIWFKSTQKSTFKYAVDDITNFIEEALKNNVTENVEDTATCNRDLRSREDNKNKFCLFDIKAMRDSSICNKQDDYGYSKNEPCILVKLNRIFGWYPKNYETGKFPDELTKKNYTPTQAENHVIITCEGENPADKENVGEIQYYPEDGIPFNYFPFLNKPGYVSPFVWVKFKKPVPGVVINIECKAWAKNIKHDRMDREGSVHFELLLD